MHDADADPNVRGIQGVRAILHCPIQAILGLQAAQRDYEAGIGNVRSIGGYLIGIGGAAVVAIRRAIVVGVRISNAASADPGRGFVRIIRAAVLAIGRGIVIAVSVRNAASPW